RSAPSAHTLFRPLRGRYRSSCPRASRIILLAANRLDQRLRALRAAARHSPGGRALNESAAEHARLARRRIVEHTGLAGRDALFARDQLDLVTAVAAAQPRRLRRPRRAHPHKNLKARADRAIDLAVADPVDVAKLDPVHPQ